MVRVQAAEAGTVGGDRFTFRKINRDELVNLAPGSPVPDWMVVVPDDTKEPLDLIMDQKTKKWVIKGQRAKEAEKPLQTFSELAKNEDAALKKSGKALPSL